MKYALIGRSLSHSYSQVLHMGYGLDYVLHPLEPDALGDFVRTCPYDGYNVTVPYKQAIIPHLDDLSPLARRLGAVNTVKREGDRWVGYNTDYAGFEGALTHFGVDVGGKHALVLGSGGASAVVQAVLADRGATVTVVSRSGPVDYANCYLPDVSVVVNATPVGTHPHGDVAPVDVTRWTDLSFVYDLVYNPMRNALMSSCVAQGVPHANGLTMLVIQALAARSVWLGRPYTPDEVAACLTRLQGLTANVALVGMPGVGKSTVGARLAAQLGCEVVDTDELVTLRQGLTPEQIIRTQGEAAFREVEAAAVREACDRRGVVITTGGGCVLREDNRRLLRQTSLVVWLQRDLSDLSAEGRPTLQQSGADALYRIRRPLYQEVADHIVFNRDIDQTVAKIRDFLRHNGRA